MSHRATDAAPAGDARDAAPGAEPAYVLEDAAIHGPRGPIVRDVNLTIPERAVTVLVGPGGAGKSSVLHALSGRRLPDELRLEGAWRRHGRPRPRWITEDIFLLPQRRPDVPASAARDPFETAAPVLLLDEPCHGQPPEALAALAARLRQERAHRTIILVTHHVAFAREVADQVALLCGGAQDCAAPAGVFFARPPTPMAERYIAQGNCWPPAELPRHFRWVSPMLAGMARPGLGDALERELAALGAAGIGTVVSLTEDAPPVAALAQHGLESLHLPIRDMGVPALADARALCDAVRRRLDAGSRVVMHCHGGVGRTGTLLACQLVHGGHTAAEAIRAVRAAIRLAIQTPEQEEFVSRFERALGRAA